MTIEEKKEFLESYKELDDYINELLDEKKHWYDLMMHCASPKEACVKRDINIKATDMTVDKIMSLEKQINRSIDLLANFRSLILQELESLNDLKLKRIIQLKYIKGMTIEQIAEQTGYCARQISRLHKVALNAIFEHEDTPICNDKAIV